MTVKQVFNTSADLDFPNVLPTLDLDFANSKTLDPRITFTRASGGSYVGADGLIKYAGVNEPRFDHDPVTGESLGLLIEESRQNLLLRSEEFHNVLWIKTRSSISQNAITAPDGSLTADKLVEDTTANNNHLVYIGSLGLTQNIYTFSVYVKSAERTRITLRIDTNIQQRNVTFDLISGTVLNVFGSSGQIDYLGNGWYRCINTMNVAEQVINAVLMIMNDAGQQAYTGDGTSGIYIWGAQLEQGAFPTSYIPTQGSTRTRAADNCIITGKNFSEWYRQDEGTIYSNYITRVPTNVNQNNIDFVIENGASTNRIIGWNNFGKNQVFSLIENNIANYVFSGSIPKINIPVKKIISIKDYDVKMYVGTDSLIGDFASSVPDKVPRNLTRMVIGVGNGFSPLNGTITRLTYWPKRLPNSQLISLTI